jgi:hypothetical protein
MNRLGIGVLHILRLGCKKCEQVKRDSEGLTDSLQNFQTRLSLSTLQHADEAGVHGNPLRELALWHIGESSRNTNGF